MKKVLLFAAAAVAMLASCSNDETFQTSQTGSQIGFTGSFVNKGTRGATVTTTNNIDNFTLGVYGYMKNASNETTLLFDNQEVTNDGTSWTYSPLKYWIPKNSYAFTAIAPKNAATFTPAVPTEGLSFTNGNGTIEFANATGTVDLLYAFNSVTDAAANQAPVGFTFNHILSQIKVQFTNTFESTSAKLVVKNVKITSAATGSVAMNPATKAAITGIAWESEGTATFDYKFQNEDNVLQNASQKFGTNTSAASDAYFVIPEDQVTIDFTVELWSGSAKAGEWSHKVYVPVDGGYLPGYSYLLTAALNEQNVADESLNPILFDVNVVNNWVDGGTVEMDIPTINLDVTTAQMQVGGAALALTATLTTSLDNPEVTWTSSNSAVATVNPASTTGLTGNATVTAVATGETTITASFTTATGSVMKASCVVTVL